MEGIQTCVAADSERAEFPLTLRGAGEPITTHDNNLVETPPSMTGIHSSSRSHPM